MVRRKGAKRVLGLSHRSVAIFVVGGLVAALAAIMLAKLGSDAGDLPSGPQLLEAPHVLGLRLGIAPLIVAAPSSQMPLQILVDSRDEVPAKSFLNVSGLPSTVLLSPGRAIGPGEWVVPFSWLSNLMMTVPADVLGKFEIAITFLAAWDDSPPTFVAQARTTLLIAPVGVSVAYGRERSGTTSAEPNAPAALRANGGEAPVEPQHPVIRPAGESVDAEVVPSGPTTDALQEHTHAALQPARTAVATTSPPPRSNVNQVAVEATSPASKGLGGGASGVQTTDTHQNTTDAASQPLSAAMDLPTAPAPQPTSAAPHRPAETSDRDPWSPLVAYAQNRLADVQVDAGEESAARHAPTVSLEERARGEGLVAEGERYLADGNLGLARQFFQRAAEAGIARGALLLGATYDPRELASLNVLGNPAIARKWYERARTLGAPESEVTRKANSKLTLPTVPISGSLDSGSPGPMQCIRAGGWGTGALQGFATYMAEAAMQDSAKAKFGETVKIGNPTTKCETMGLLYECTAYARACR